MPPEAVSAAAVLPAAEIVCNLGFTCVGVNRGSQLPGYPSDPTAWLDAPPASYPRWATRRQGQARRQIRSLVISAGLRAPARIMAWLSSSVTAVSISATPSAPPGPAAP
jgi:hypothetical protein